MTEDELMLTSVLNCRRVDLLTEPKNLTDDQSAKLHAMRKRRLSGEPLQYILGDCEFMNVRLRVDKRVLIPRPETEVLVDRVIDYLRLLKREDSLLKILDLGTGSGNIATVIAKNIPECHVTAIDTSLDALSLAKENAKLNSVQEKIDFIKADISSFLKRPLFAQEKFDLIVSNPPYVPSALLKSLPEDVRHEPRLALDGGEDGLEFYRIIAEYAYRHLKKGGIIFLEIGDEQRLSVEKIFSSYSYYKNIQFEQDLNQRDRITIIQC